MRFTWKTLIAMACSALGVFGWLYVGGWMVLTKPVKGIIVAQLAGNLSITTLIGALAQGFLYLSLAGGIWCVGYILSSHFKD